MKRFMGKVVAVTGGTSGIGLAVVKRFLAEGAKVIMTAKGDERGKTLEMALKSDYGDCIHFYRCDVSDEENVRKLFQYVGDTCGKLDILHNNAGVSVGGDLEHTTSEEWDKTINVNLKGAFLCAQNALPYLKQSRGVIINTISELGFVATKGCIAYLCSKGGLLQLTRGLALELAPFGIRVNAVCPAGTDTPLFRDDMGKDGHYDENVARLARSYPLGRIAVPEDIAPAVLYLASEESSFMTGQYILLDGGFTIQ